MWYCYTRSSWVADEDTSKAIEVKGPSNSDLPFHKSGLSVLLEEVFQKILFLGPEKVVLTGTFDSH